MSMLSILATCKALGLLNDDLEQLRIDVYYNWPLEEYEILNGKEIL